MTEEPVLQQGSHSKQALGSRQQSVLLFSVGGRRLAVMMEEVVGVTSWNGFVPVTGETPFLSGLVRQDQAVLPVCDLAGRLQVPIEGGHPLCLVAKHPLGNMAICIDEALPMMQTCDSVGLRSYLGKEFPAQQSCMVELEEIPILSLSRLLLR